MAEMLFVVFMIVAVVEVVFIVLVEVVTVDQIFGGLRDELRRLILDL